MNISRKAETMQAVCEKTVQEEIRNSALKTT